MPTHKKDDYATLSTPGTKKISVCARRIGSRNRMSVIAVCTDETRAEQIVTALKRLQGDMVELETPAQMALTDVRNALTSAHSKCAQLETEKRAWTLKERDMARDLATMTDRAVKAERDRDAAIERAIQTGEALKVASQQVAATT